jgi:hypothetical protein
MIPGEYLIDGPDLELNAGRPVVTLTGRSRLVPIITFLR